MFNVICKFILFKNIYFKYILNYYYYSCHEYGHYSLNCPYIHYIPDNEGIILKNLF